MKTLIYLNKKEIIKNSGRGGPLGVAFHLYLESKKDIDNYFAFLENVNTSQSSKLKHTIKSMIPKSIVKFRESFKFNGLFNDRYNSDLDFSDYNIILFHTTFDLFNVRNSLKDYTGKIVLQSHSPVPFAQEYYSEVLTDFERKYFKKTYSKLPLIDEYAFKKADYIIYPCPEAEESYIKNWNEYSSIIKDKRDKILFVETGIKEKVCNTDILSVRKKYGVSDNDFLISYVGRHNKIKGFDILKNIASELFKHDGYKVISAGKEFPIKRLENPNWIEIGYTTEADAIISASDIFVLPNRETYFDLVMIEVLSLKKIVVASRTGGNKYYERNNVKGVFLYDTPEEAVEIIKRIKSLSSKEREELGEANYKFFKSHLTSEIYYKKYKDTIIKITQELD